METIERNVRMISCIGTGLSASALVHNIFQTPIVVQGDNVEGQIA